MMKNFSPAVTERYTKHRALLSPGTDDSSCTCLKLALALVGSSRPSFVFLSHLIIIVRKMPSGPLFYLFVYRTLLFF